MQLLCIERISLKEIIGGDFDIYRLINLKTSALVWEDFKIPASSAQVGPANVPGFETYGVTNFATYRFDAAAMEELHFFVQLPHDWKEGTSLGCHVHWSVPTTDAWPKTVTWGLEYTWSNIDAAIGASTTIKATKTLTADADLNKHLMTDLGFISATGKTMSSMIICRIFRDVASDSYTKDAILLEIDFHYQKDSLGSKQEKVK